MNHNFAMKVISVTLSLLIIAVAVLGFQPVPVSAECEHIGDGRCCYPTTKCYAWEGEELSECLNRKIGGTDRYVKVKEWFTFNKCESTAIVEGEIPQVYMCGIDNAANVPCAKVDMWDRNATDCDESGFEVEYTITAPSCCGTDCVFQV